MWGQEGGSKEKMEGADTHLHTMHLVPRSKWVISFTHECSVLTTGGVILKANVLLYYCSVWRL